MNENYSIYFSRSARKELEALPSTILAKVLTKIEALSTNPRPSNCVKIRGHMNLWRIRVGDYRVVYAIDDEHKLVDIVLIRHRKDAYR